MRSPTADGSASRLTRPARTLAPVIAAVLVYAAVTIAATFPLTARMRENVVGDVGDPLMLAWVLAWDYHALTTRPASLFDANILYPAERTLGLSEHMLGVLPIFAVPYAMTGNPILALNVVVLVSFVLSGLALFLLVRLLTGSASAGLIAGLIFAFAPVRLAQLPHAQLLSLYWTPLAIYFLERFLRTGRGRHAAAAVGCLTLQALASIYLAYLAAVAVAVYLAVRLAAAGGTRARTVLVRLALIGVVPALFLVWLHRPYLAVRSAWGQPWSLLEVILYSASPLDFVAGGGFHRLLGAVGSTLAVHEKTVFLGVVVAALVAVALTAPSRAPVDGPARRALLGVLLVALVLSLGPHLMWRDQEFHVNLPYAWLMWIVPGFTAMRVPARFGLVVAVAAAALAGLGYARLESGLHVTASGRRFWRAGLAVVVGGAILAEVWVAPLQTVRVPIGARIPPVYRWLAAEPGGGPIAEIPQGVWEDYLYTYFSTVHWRPIVNGATSYLPASFREMVSRVNELPDAKAVQLLSAVGLREVVVHRRAQTSAASFERWSPERATAGGLVEVARFGDDVVYRLPPARAGRAALALDLRLGPAGPDGAIPLGLAARSIGDTTWVQPHPLGRTAVAGQWTCASSDEPARGLEPITLPVALSPGSEAGYSLAVRQPARPDCTLTVSVPRLGLTTRTTLPSASPGRAPGH